MPNEETFFQMLIQALQLVAADAATQMEVLPSGVHIPDEVVLTFDESYLLFDQVIEAGLVNSAQVEAVQKLHQHIHEMTLARDLSLWTLEAMKSHPKWDEMRGLAKDTLTKLGVDTDRPNLGWINYVPSGN